MYIEPRTGFAQPPVGLLFIGDPHASSKRVGRRKDDFAKSVLGKLAHCAKICHEQALIPCILGDLFHRDDENSLRLLTRLIRACRAFPVTPIVLGGNHDKGETSFADGDALVLLAEAGAVRLVDTTELIEHFDFPGGSVDLWGVPYGAEIPDALPASTADNVVMMTHADLAFGSTYPGALPLKPVAHCHMVVNGHMHDTKPSVLNESTWWHNPGNIEPLSIDLIDHVPKAWGWKAGSSFSALEGNMLPHEADIFDLQGIQVAAAGAQEAVDAWAPKESFFAQELLAVQDGEAGKTEDGSVLREDLEEILSVSLVSSATADYLRRLNDKYQLHAVGSSERVVELN
jgi:hypothetical protein